MAASGTITQVVNNLGQRVTTISGVTQGSNSTPFTLKSDDNSSYQVTGTFGGTSAQWQGSNDGTNWSNIGSALVAAGTGTLTANDQFYAFYQLLLTGGDGTTSLNSVVVSMIQR